MMTKMTVKIMMVMTLNEMKWQGRKGNDGDGTDERNRNEVLVKRTDFDRDKTGDESEHCTIPVFAPD